MLSTVYYIPSGVSSGIGRVTAEKLAKQGCSVFGTNEFGILRTSKAVRACLE